MFLVVRDTKTISESFNKHLKLLEELPVEMVSKIIQPVLPIFLNKTEFQHKVESGLLRCPHFKPKGFLYKGMCKGYKTIHNLLGE